MYRNRDSTTDRHPLAQGDCRRRLRNAAGARAAVLLVVSALLYGCGPASGAPTSSATSQSIPASASPSFSESPTLAAPDAAQATQVALQLFAGGGDAATGRYDCLTNAATCPVTDRLRARFAAFADSARPNNAGGGSSDPLCRVCQSPFSDVKVNHVDVVGAQAIAYVDLYFGSGSIPLAVVEIDQGTDVAVDDVLCVVNGKPQQTSSLYLVTQPAC